MMNCKKRTFCHAKNTKFQNGKNRDGTLQMTKHEALRQRLLNVGPPSSTPAQH